MSCGERLSASFDLAQQALVQKVMREHSPGSTRGLDDRLGRWERFIEEVETGYDGVISILDLSRMSQSSGTSRGQAGFDFRADLDGDGAVSILDLTRESAYFGLACPGQQTRYYYDGDGALLKRTNGLPASLTSTIYIGGVYEKQQDGTVTKYYQAAGRLLHWRRFAKICRAIARLPRRTSAGHWCCWQHRRATAP